MVKKFQAEQPQVARRQGDRETSSQEVKIVKERAPKFTKSFNFGYMSDEARIEALHTLAKFLFEYPPPQSEGQSFAKFTSMTMIPIKLGSHGRVVISKLIDVLLPFSKPVLGFEVFEKIESDHFMVFCFRTRIRQSASLADQFFSFAIQFAFMIAQREQYFYFSRTGPLPAQIVKQVNQEAGAHFAPEDTAVWVLLEQLMESQSFTILFKWFPEIIQLENGSFIPGMALDSSMARSLTRSLQEEYNTLVGTVCASVNRYVISELFKTQMIVVGENLFGKTTGNWLRVQSFSSQTGGLLSGIQGLQARREFKLFVSSFDPSRLAYMTFDSFTERCYNDAREQLVPNLRPLFDASSMSPSQKVLSVREEFQRIWIPMIEESLHEYVGTLAPADQGVFEENHGLLQKLIAFSEVVCSAPILNMAELDLDTLANFAVFGYYVLTWCKHSQSSSKMSLLIQGVSGGGKSLMVQILSNIFGFARVDFKGVTMFQNAEVGQAAGFVAEELDLTPGNLDLLRMLRDWGAWTDPKMIRVKFGANVWTKKFCPFVSSTNHDLDDWSRTFLNSAQSQARGTADSLRRRYSVIEVLTSNVSHAYSNHFDVMEGLDKAIARLALTAAVVCYGAEFLASVRVYEYVNIFQKPVDQQPLQQMFRDLVYYGSTSTDFVLKAICLGNNEVSSRFIGFVRQAVDTSRTSMEQRDALRQRLRERKNDFTRALNNVFSSAFEGTVFYFGDIKVSVGVEFDGSGFAKEQELFVSSGTSLGDNDPSILVRDPKKLVFNDNMSKIKFVDAVRDKDVSVQTGVFQWIAYLTRIHNAPFGQIAAKATEFTDPQKNNCYHFCQLLQAEREESKMVMKDESDEISQFGRDPFKENLVAVIPLKKDENFSVAQHVNGETSFEKQVNNARRLYEESFEEQQQFYEGTFAPGKNAKQQGFPDDSLAVTMRTQRLNQQIGRDQFQGMRQRKEPELGWILPEVKSDLLSLGCDTSSLQVRPEMSLQNPGDYLSVRCLATATSPNVIRNLGAQYDPVFSCVEEIVHGQESDDY